MNHKAGSQVEHVSTAADCFLKLHCVFVIKCRSNTTVAGFLSSRLLDVCL